jgi:hypothetical protein
MATSVAFGPRASTAIPTEARAPFPRRGIAVTARWPRTDAASHLDRHAGTIDRHLQAPRPLTVRSARVESEQVVHRVVCDDALEQFVECV